MVGVLRRVGEVLLDLVEARRMVLTVIIVAEISRTAENATVRVWHLGFRKVICYRHSQTRTRSLKAEIGQVLSGRETCNGGFQLVAMVQGP